MCAVEGSGGRPGRWVGSDSPESGSDAFSEVHPGPVSGGTTPKYKVRHDGSVVSNARKGTTALNAVEVERPPWRWKVQVRVLAEPLRKQMTRPGGATAR